MRSVCNSAIMNCVQRHFVEGIVRGSGGSYSSKRFVITRISDWRTGNYRMFGPCLSWDCTHWLVGCSMHTDTLQRDTKRSIRTDVYFTARALYSVVGRHATPFDEMLPRIVTYLRQ